MTGETYSYIQTKDCVIVKMESAYWVKEIYSAFSRDVAVSEIVKALNDSGVPVPYAADSWSRESVVFFLKIEYAGIR